MMLNMIREISNIDLSDADVLTVAKVLWAIMPKSLKKDARPILFSTLVDGKDMDLPKELIEPLVENLEAFRHEIWYAQSQSDNNDNPLSRYTFLRSRLQYSKTEALPLLEEAVRQGNPVAARIYYGEKVEDSNLKDFNAKVSAAEELIKIVGEKEGIDVLAKAYEFAGEEETYYRLIFRGADLGNTYCCWKAAMKCQKEQKYEQAAKYFEIGRFDHDPDAAFEYALTYWIKGYGRVQPEYAEDLMMRAAMAGSAEAAAHLGKSCLWASTYREGRGKDIAKAKYFLEMAESRGHYDAGYFVGCICDGLYENEPEEFIDHEEAMRHWEALAKRDHGDSLTQIGCAYYNGDHGYVKNLDLAWMYFREAATRYSSLGCAYFADMIAAKQAPGTKELAVYLFVEGMASYVQDDREIAKQCLSDAYTYGKKFPKDPEWSEFIKSFPIEYQGSFEKTFRWISEQLIAARIEHIRQHPELDDGVDWQKTLAE